jgi:hypothetical protein
LSATAVVGGVERFGVEGLELGAEVAGVAMTGVEESVVMIGSAAGGFREEGVSAEALGRRA